MLHGKHSNKQSTAVILNLRTSPESVKILLLLNIKLFLSMILLFPKVVVFARIKAEILGERRKILFLTPGESRCESKCYKFPRTSGSILAAPVMKKIEYKTALFKLCI